MLVFENYDPLTGVYKVAFTMIMSKRSHCMFPACLVWVVYQRNKDIFKSTVMPKQISLLFLTTGLVYFVNNTDQAVKHILYQRWVLSLYIISKQLL